MNNRRIIRGNTSRDRTTKTIKPVRNHFYSSSSYISPILPFRKTVSSSVLLTGGIGDFIAVDSFLSTEQKNSINTLYLATRAYAGISSIAKNIYPNLKDIIVLNTDWSKIFCAFSLGHLKNVSKEQNWKIDFSILPSSILDLSILYAALISKTALFIYALKGV